MVVGDGHSTLKELINRKNTRARAEFETITLGEVERETLKSTRLETRKCHSTGIQVLLRYDATFNTGSQAYEVLDEIDSSYLTGAPTFSASVATSWRSFRCHHSKHLSTIHGTSTVDFLECACLPSLSVAWICLITAKRRPIAQKIIERFN